MLPDLSNYRLAFPVNPEGKPTGKCVTLEYPDFLTAYSEWFKVDGKRMVFRAPDGGATTSSKTEFCRTELRDLREFGIHQRAKDNLRFIAPSMPEGGKIVLMQIHDKNEPWIKVTLDYKGKLYGRIRNKDGGSEYNVTLLTGVNAGDNIAISIDFRPATEAEPQMLIIIVKSGTDGGSWKVPMFRTGKYGNAYFKRGAYVQDKRRKGYVYEVIHI